MVRIGDSPPRPDGPGKVTGSLRYTDDLTMPDLLYGATVRSSHAHARIRDVRWRPELAPVDSRFVGARDLPGPNGVQLIDDEWPILADRITRHVAEPVALVAAPTRLDALRARGAVEVDYEPLDPVLTWEEAEKGESLTEISMQKGNVEGALAGSSRVIETEYRTGHQEHIYIECQAMMAWFEEDGSLRVVGSMQCPYYVHKSLMHAFGLPEEKVKVKVAAVGGGFGGKEDYPSLIAIHTALLARASGRPVKMIYDRHEDIVATTKRHPSLIRHRTGVDEEGRLTAMDIEVLFDGGAYRTLSSVVLSRGVLHATGAYRCPHVRVRGRVLRTNTVPNAAFRGFGAPQVLFAVERHLDRVGREMGTDPLTIRERNVLEVGDTLATGQVMGEGTSARECLQEVAQRTDFRRRWQELEEERKSRPDGALHRGIGISLYFHGAGFTGRGEHRMRSPVTVKLRADGKMEVLTAQTDMGQGAVIVLPLIAAEAAGVRLEDLHFPDPDTALVPDSGPTVASRTTMVVGGTIARAVVVVRDQLLSWLGQREGVSGSLQLSEGQVTSGNGFEMSFEDAVKAYVAEHGPLELTLHNEPPEWQKFDETTYQGVAYATYAWGADVVEVEVDPDTLETRPLQATVVCEVGKVIHRKLCVGQIEGGTLQAVAWGYMEEIKLQDGRYLNDRLATYIIPTVKDSPHIQVHLLERPYEGGPFGAKGVGELPMDGGAPATVGAIENATGIRSDEIPATPERLLRSSLAGDTVSGAKTAFGVEQP